MPASFKTLPLSPEILANLDQLGYTEMTAIQSASLPLALAGNDLIAQASTGSGKTAAFGLPLVDKLTANFHAVQGLVMCPTRELADQVTSEIRRLARSTANIKVVTLCGGVALRGQEQSLQHGAHVVVGTPGRILDHLARGNLRLDSVKTFVLDEADRMLDMGFFDDMKQLMQQCPTHRQTLLFSATYSDGIVQLSAQFMREPQIVKVQTVHQTDKIRQVFYQVQEDQRLHAVSLLLNHFRPVSTIAFCNTKQQCRGLQAVLQAQGFDALALYGELEQRERDQVLVQFANRSCSVLVATDVAARGLDISQLHAVINVDVTPDAELHIHRIGRTGRADAQGLALTLASLEEMGAVGRIEVMLGQASVWDNLSTLTLTEGEPLHAPMRTLQIVGGRKEKIRAGDVLGALTGEAGFSAHQIGKIHVNEFSTYVAVDRGIAESAIQRLSKGRIKGKTVRVRLLNGLTNQR